ncbi:MAG TPA: hypothetical protein VF988_08615 [Verrucomicrobiae bacterium]
MNRIRVAFFTDRMAAEPVRVHLRQAGVPAVIQDEPWLTWLWFVPNHRAGKRIEVPLPYFKLAERLLLTWNAEGELRAAIHCPECGSLRVDYPQFTEKSFVTNLAFGFLAGVGLIEKDFYCEHCHFMWSSKDAKR